MIETGPVFFWNRGLGLGLDNNNLTLVSVESGACAMTSLWHRMDYESRVLNFKNNLSDRWVIKTEGLQSPRGGTPSINHE